jgi:hypothetical protein
MKNKKIAYAAIAATIVIICSLIGYWAFSKSSGVISHSSSLSGGSNSVNVADPSAAISEYDYTDAPNHIGEKATVRGTVVKVFTSKGGVTFFDYCKSSTKCPFSAVIFASDLDKFGDVSKYERAITVTGVIRSYQGTAEIVINDPGQIQ